MKKEKKMKPCKECPAMLEWKATVCPDCGAEWYAEFTFQKGDVVICSTKGKEVAFGRDAHNPYILRINGKPTTYHPNYGALLREMRLNGVKASLSDETMISIERLIQTEKDALDWIKQADARMRKAVNNADR